jgi:hypothetical protein
MVYFPQLLTGAMSQYPISRRRDTRTTVTFGHEGHAVKLADPDDQAVRWEMQFTGLTDSEWAAIEAVFHACEGSLRPFCFLDPAHNLLSWSEELQRAIWQKDPLLQTTEGLNDIFGGTQATRIMNIGQTEQTIWQVLDVPASFHYCLSVYARSVQATEVRLKQWCTASSRSTAATVSSGWRRLLLSANLESSEEGVHFGLGLAAGASVEVYGLQVEAQKAASEYKRTHDQGGIYPRARFASDELRVLTDGPDNHSSVIRITAGVRQN